MNENVKKWVNALRSGNFSQTKSKLKDDNGYCCLGIACELYAEENGLDWKYDDLYGGYVFDGELETLPDSVVTWLGLGTANGTFVEPEKDYQTVTLSELNDTGYDFDYIADVIESDPEQLFVN